MLTQGYKLYTPYFNGYPQCDQRVFIKKNEVLIFKIFNDNGEIYEKNNDNNFVKKFITKKIFLGKNSKSPVNEESGAIGSKFDNSTIILYLGNDKYIMLNGKDIIKFTTKDKLKSLHAPVGNSGCPYPYAIGEKFIHSFVHPKGKISVKYFPNLTDQKKVGERIFFFEPFIEKNKKYITIGKFMKVISLPLDKIKTQDLSDIYKTFDIDGAKRIYGLKFDKNKTRRENLIYFLEKLSDIKFLK
jgi:hypothetical protein